MSIFACYRYYSYTSRVQTENIRGNAAFKKRSLVCPKNKGWICAILSCTIIWKSKNIPLYRERPPSLFSWEVCQEPSTLFFVYMCCFQKSLCNVEISACLWLYMAAAKRRRRRLHSPGIIMKYVKSSGLKLQFAATSLNMAAALS